MMRIQTQKQHFKPSQKAFGFSMIELLIGVVIGLMTTLAITHVFSSFEGRKRMITSGNDAQSSGVLAMYYIQRDAQNAGFGLPLNNSNDPSPLLCPLNTSINQGGVVMNLTPVQITDGGTGSDTINIRYGTSPSGGASMRATGVITAPTLDSKLIGCQLNDVVLLAQTPTSPKCSLGRLNKLNADRTIQLISDLNTAPTDTPVTDLNSNDRVRFSCLGVWNQYQYTVNANSELTRSGGISSQTPFPDASATPIVSDIVSLQAQYGITNSVDANSSATTSAKYLNQVGQWVDATNTYGSTMNLDNRNRIRAIRVAIVARDGAMQKDIVSQACNGALPGVNKVCIWTSDETPASVYLGANPDWQMYRYKVFEAVIPLRNVLWNRDAL